jgi:hypothetical protein
MDCSEALRVVTEQKGEQIGCHLPDNGVVRCMAAHTSRQAAGHGSGNRPEMPLSWRAFRHTSAQL